MPLDHVAEQCTKPLQHEAPAARQHVVCAWAVAEQCTLLGNRVPRVLNTCSEHVF